MIIDPEFQSFIPPLTETERASLEASLVAAGGATDPLIYAVIDGQNVLLDGHNRYEITERLGLNRHAICERSVTTRAAAKAWIFEHQIARRNLSVDQLVMLAAVRGVATKSGTSLMRERAAFVAEKAPERAAAVIAGKYSVALAWGALQPRKPYAPRPPRGPSAKPPIPEGHELAGLSTLSGPDGGVKGEWAKTRVAGNDDPAPPPPDFALKSVSTMTRGDGSEVVRWESYDREKAERHEALMRAWENAAKSWDGLATPIALPARSVESSLSVYPIGDHHLGMLAWGPETGESWDIKHGQDSLRAAVGELVRMAEPSERALICNLGDFLHAQDDRAVTPRHGNRLDVDGRHAKVADAAVALLVGVIDVALTKHKHVIVRNLPGNHDPEVAPALARALRAWYRNEPRVEIADAYRVHQYDRFGSNLFGWHHGDQTPAHELPAIMAVDQREAWGETQFHWWHCGHVHHKIKDKEHPGCVIETHRILPPGDAWHAGRYRAGRGMSVITYDREFGEVGRATIGIEQVKALLARKAET